MSTKRTYTDEDGEIVTVHSFESPWQTKDDLFFRAIEAGEIPEEKPWIYDDGSCKRVALFGEYKNEIHGRDYCTARGMWACVYKSWVTKLAQWIDGRSVLEIMGGYGWLSKALRREGVEILCTDDGSWGKRRHFDGQPVTEIMELDAVGAVTEAAQLYDIVLCSWPHKSSAAFIDACKLIPGKTFIYIGEDDKGCCAAPEFFKLFVADPRKDQPVTDLFTWDLVYDSVKVGRINQ